MTSPGRLCSCLVVLAACGPDGNSTVDAPPDPCAPEMQVTGEFIDWDSTPSNFHGVFGAQFTLRTDTTKTASTAPNGRFILCVPAADGLIDVVPMAGSSYVNGTVVVNKQVVQSGAMLSYRSFTMTRAADFAYAANQAQVFVHVAGSARAVSTSAAAAVKKHFDNGTWVDGDTGTDVYLGGIDPGSGTTTLSVSGSTTGAGSIPLTAGAFTYVTVVAR